jgi:DUF4097 and DUF4098 domain-containing protein YvlB
MNRTLLLPLLAALGTLPALAAAAQSPAEKARTVRERVRDVRVSVSQREDRRSEQTDRQTRTVRIGANGALDLANISGDITITRGGGNDATIEIVKIARGRSAEDARELLNLVDVEVIERGSRAEVRTRYPSGGETDRRHRNMNVSVNLNVTAPAGARVTAKSISGNLSAQDIRGEVALESVSGNVEVRNGGRVAAAKSISGDVNVTETEIEGLLEASSASGTVTLRRVKARRLDVGSVSGDVVVDEVECANLEASSVSGDVRFGGTLAPNGRYELTSHSGSVEVAVRGGAGFELEATTFSGDIRSELALNAHEKSRRSVRGVYGDGSAMLEVTSFSGNIVITKR